MRWERETHGRARQGWWSGRCVTEDTNHDATTTMPSVSPSWCWMRRFCRHAHGRVCCCATEARISADTDWANGGADGGRRARTGAPRRRKQRRRRAGQGGGMGGGGGSGADAGAGVQVCSQWFGRGCRRHDRRVQGRAAKAEGSDSNSQQLSPCPRKTLSQHAKTSGSGPTAKRRPSRRERATASLMVLGISTPTTLPI